MADPINLVKTHPNVQEDINFMHHYDSAEDSDEYDEGLSVVKIQPDIEDDAPPPMTPRTQHIEKDLQAVQVEVGKLKALVESSERDGFHLGKPDLMDQLHTCSKIRAKLKSVLLELHVPSRAAQLATATQCSRDLDALIGRCMRIPPTPLPGALAPPLPNLDPLMELLYPFVVPAGAVEGTAVTVRALDGASKTFNLPKGMFGGVTAYVSTSALAGGLSPVAVTLPPNVFCGQRLKLGFGPDRFQFQVPVDGGSGCQVVLGMSAVPRLCSAQLPSECTPGEKVRVETSAGKIKFTVPRGGVPGGFVYVPIR